MRLVVDATRCQGHSRCRALAPDLVGADALGQAVILHTAPLGVDDQQRAALLVANCPEGALRLDDETKDTTDTTDA
jgi:ferredoxin